MATDVVSAQSYGDDIKKIANEIVGKKVVNGIVADSDVKDEISELKSTGDKPTQALLTGDELLVIQDAGFNIKIQAPGLDVFEIPVSSMELVQEIYQVLVDKEETCHRTCFTLQLDGVTLDNFSEVKSVEGLCEGSVLKVVEELYTVREARIHVRHIRDVLKSIDIIDAYSGNECNSLSLLNVITGGNILEKKPPKNPSEPSDYLPPDYLLPGSRDRPLLPLHPVLKELKGPQCLKVLTFSGWNPPPNHRKMNGDLLYIYAVTLEDKRFHITACTHGFHLNQSTIDEFNPKPVHPKHVHHSLVDLLNQISPLFKKNFQLLLKKRQQKHPFERVATPYQLYNWMSPTTEHTFDYIRSEDAFSSRLGYEEHIPGQTRDWNEELQTTRELPRKHLPERLIRERTIFKVHSDFVVAATRGAMLVIDGNIMAINPGEDTKMQMFLWNNIFLSLGFDVKDHFKDFGGDYAAYAAPGCDLQGVKAYSSIDVEGLYTLGTVVIDYRGYRVTAQSIIPGILEKEQEQSVVYGSIDFGKTIVTHDQYKDLMKKAAQSLKIRPHKVLNSKEEEVELYSSVECKGIIGNDNRHYILDLLRTFPPDVHFLPVDPTLLSQPMRDLGFPRRHRHKLACVRQELVDAFVENKYVTFVRSAASQFQALKLKKMQEAQADPQSLHNNHLSLQPATTTTTTTTTIATSIDDDDEDAKKLVETLTNVANQLTASGVSAAAETAKSLADAVADDLKKPAAVVVGEIETNGTDNNDDNNNNNINNNNNNNKPVENGRGDVGDGGGGGGGGCGVGVLVNGCSGGDGGCGGGSDGGGGGGCSGGGGGGGGVDGSGDYTKEIVLNAARLIGSLSDKDFSISFNTDLFQDHVRHSDEESDERRREKQLVINAAAFIVTDQIPGFVADCLEHTSSPIDHFTLTESLHNHGINMRYLGVVADEVAKKPQLSYLHSIVVSSLITRSSKHLYKLFMQGVDTMNLSSAISHFLNCYLGSFNNLSPQVATDEKPKKKNRRKNKGIFALIGADSSDWSNETPKSLWKKIIDESDGYYHFKIDCDSLDAACEKYEIQKVSLLRSFCKCVGIQLYLREYVLDSKAKQAFHNEDIQNVFPIVKHIHPKATDAYHVFTSGQTKIQQGLLQEGYELVIEALNLLNNVYGAMHHEIASCARLLARLSYIMGDYGEALVYQQRAVLMSERVLGIDHPNTITEYAHLALYCFANNQIPTALKLIYRALYLALLCVGETHPEIALFYCNIGLMVQAESDFELSLKYLTKALELNSKFFGPKSLKCALNYHLIARTYSCKGDFRSALHSEKESYSIYKLLLGENHDRTHESSECLKHLTNQAVKFQKTVNMLQKGEKISTMPSLQIQIPTLNNILETLNLINGIVFVHISPEDIEKFREEMLKQQIVQKMKLDDKLKQTTNDQNDHSPVESSKQPIENVANNNNEAIPLD